MKNRILYLLVLILSTCCFTQLSAQNTLDNAGLSGSTPVSGAYSFRLLSSAYSGPLARITIGTSYYDVYPDSSSNQSFSLSSPISASYSLYNDTETGATSNLLSSVVSGSTMAYVAIWYDQSGNSKAAEQATTLNQPRIINLGSIENNNGFPAMTFQNSTQVLEYSGTINVQIINTVRAVADMSYQTLFCLPANSDFSVRNDQSNSFYQPYPNYNDWAVNTNPHYLYINKTLTEYNILNNVHTVFIGAASPQTGTFSISRDDDSDRGMKNGTAVNEILLFSSTITNLERVAIENNQYDAYLIDLLTAQTAPTFQSVALAGTPTNLTVSSGIVGATFQWYQNTTESNSGGTPISGETNNWYTPDTSSEGTSYYYATISSAGTTVPSKAVSVRVGIEIISQPSSSNQIVVQGEAITPLSVQATGNNLAYQWYSNSNNDNSTGTLINGATSSSYSPDNANLGTTYYYAIITVGNTILVSHVSGAIIITTTPAIWNGPSITFQKANNADYHLSANQDFLTNNVIITRGDIQGLFNIVSESSSGGRPSSSPLDTEWAQGTLANFANLNYESWGESFNWNPPSQVNNTFVVHLISDNIYFELTLLQWSGYGGGFSYSRTTPCTPPSDPTASNQSFSSGATVADLVATGTAIKWYSASTGGSPLTSSTTLATGTYYLSQTVNDCESSRVSVEVEVANCSQTSSSRSLKLSNGSTLAATLASQSNWTISGGADQALFSIASNHILNFNSVANYDSNASNSYLVNVTNGCHTMNYTITISPLCGSWEAQGGDGLTQANPGRSAYQIKRDYPNATDGLYWISNPNINNNTPFQIYADMTTNGGGWTLIMCNNDNAGWDGSNAILRNENSPTINGVYSIISYADYLKKSASGFQYMLEATTRGDWGGIWTANQAYSFVHTDIDQTDVTLNTRFGNWWDSDDAIEHRLPWYYSSGPGVITTSSDPGNSWWGTLVSVQGFSPAPWLGCCGNTDPQIIWYWVR